MKKMMLARLDVAARMAFLTFCLAPVCLIISPPLIIRDLFAAGINAATLAISDKWEIERKMVSEFIPAFREGYSRLSRQWRDAGRK